MKLVSRFSSFKADWNNHLIAFISTVVGILIAFELQDWQENRQQQAHQQMAIESLKAELKENNGILKNAIAQLQPFNEYTDFIVRHLHTDSTIICTQAEWSSIVAAVKNNGDLKGAIREDQLIRRIGDQHIEIAFEVPVTFFVSRLRTDSWEAVKSSGILATFPYERLSIFTRLYSELNRSNTGVTADDFLIQARSSPDVRKLHRVTRELEFDYTVKSWRIGEVYDQIMSY